MKILIGSKNPVKISGAKLAFEKYFDDVEVEGVSVTSEVSEQPFNDEILIGARNRVKNVKNYAEQNNIQADYYLSIESGITNQLGFWLNYNIAIIVDNNGNESIGTSEGFPIPERYIEEIKQNDLGHLMERLSTINNIKQKFGGVYFLTHKITRENLTEHAFIMALTKFINGDIWKE